MKLSIQGQEIMETLGKVLYTPEATAVICAFGAIVFSYFTVHYLNKKTAEKRQANQHTVAHG